MPTFQVTIKNPEAEKLLRNLAAMDLIEIDGEKSTPSKPPFLRKAGWGKDTIARVLPSFDDPLEEFDEGDGVATIPRYFGCGKDVIKAILPSFDDPLEEFKEYE